VITQVKAYSREYMGQNLHQLSANGKNFFISVVDPLAGNVFPDSHDRAITLRFDDVSPDMFESQEHFEQICEQMAKYGRPYQLFSNVQADEVVTFVTRLHESAAEVVLHVHCTFGVSRSGAIALYAAQTCQLDMNSFAASNPQIHPNQLVLQTLNRSAVG